MSRVSRFDARSLLRRFLLSAILACIAIGMTGCQPKIDVSTDAKDTDLSPFHPEVLTGSGFTVQPDVRVFTLFAYLNGVAGWDVEYGDGFTPQRAELRKAVQDRLSTVDPKAVQRWKTFYDRHKRIAYQYLYYTMALGAPPDFDYIIPIEQVKYPEIIQALNGLNKILAEFYVQAGMQELFEQRFRAQMMEEVNKYDRQRIEQQVGAIYQYLRLDPTKAQGIDVVIVPAPYNSHYDANSLQFEKRLFIVEGPGSNDYGLNMHEYIHMLMDDLLPADFAGQKSKYQAIWQANRNAKYVKNSYGELHTYVEECLVRALDHRLRAKLDPSRQAQEMATLRDEAANGLALIPDFYQELEAFEANPALDARGFFTQMLKDVAQKK